VVVGDPGVVVGDPVTLGEAEAVGDGVTSVIVVGATIVSRGAVGVNCGTASTVHPGAPVAVGLHTASGERPSDTRTEM
jgi:hypothetical protein